MLAALSAYVPFGRVGDGQAAHCVGRKGCVWASLCCNFVSLGGLGRKGLGSRHATGLFSSGRRAAGASGHPEPLHQAWNANDSAHGINPLGEGEVTLPQSLSTTSCVIATSWYQGV